MKIGLFICHCGFNIAAILDIPKIMEYFQNLKEVIVFDNKYLCADTGLNELIDNLKENEIDRIVIAACSFKMHGDMFRDRLENTGLIKKEFIVFANIREQNSWVHRKESDLATQKAIEQIDAMIEYVKLLKPTKREQFPITKSALIIGGGVAGIHGALAIANAGKKVVLVEKESTIGGHMALFDKTFPTLDCSICILGPIMNEVKNHPNITLLVNSEVKKVEGFIGNFLVTVKTKPIFVDPEKCVGCFDICRDSCPIKIPSRFFPKKAIDVNFSQAIPLVPIINMDYCTGCGACEIACDREAIIYDDKEKILSIKTGAILISTGFKEYDPTGLREYGYGDNLDVITGLEMERMLNSDGPTKGKIIVPSTGLIPKKIAYALCVGSRNKNIGKEYCSGVCCSYSIKQSVLIKERIPNTDVVLYYNDIRTTSKGAEEFYNRAREEYGVKFVKGAISSIQKGNENSSMKVLAENILEGKIVNESYDLVILASALEPSKETNQIANLLNVSVDQYGFIIESHLKIRPTQTTIQGIYLAGAVQGPKNIPQSISQAESSAAKIISLLNKSELEISTQKVQLNESKCDLCRLCLDVCHFQALHIEKDKIILDSTNCTGCGACSAMCHTDALWIPGFKTEQISKQVDTYLINKSQKPLIIAFLCNWCSYSGADLAGTSKFQYPTNVRIIRVMCSAMVNPSWVTNALLSGADGVLIGGCYEQDCHYIDGFSKTLNRFESMEEILKELNIDLKRVRLESISAGEGRKFADIIDKFSKELIE
ncbi:MAG: hydrogenase iron-sulfur subunit [archaeon]|nr:hydrogenase iron-sulfur subunit [archaeon]